MLFITLNPYKHNDIYVHKYRSHKKDMNFFVLEKRTIKYYTVKIEIKGQVKAKRKYFQLQRIQL